MYSTVIRQQHMMDRAEQDRLLSLIAQKYYKTKDFNTEQHNANPVRRMMLLKQHRVTALRLRSPPSLHRKVQREEILISTVLHMCVSLLILFLLTVLNLLLCVLEESLTVVTERDSAVLMLNGGWQIAAAERRVYMNWI